LARQNSALVKFTSLLFFEKLGQIGDVGAGNAALFIFYHSDHLSAAANAKEI
jgi:hypothetical protein